MTTPAGWAGRPVLRLEDPPLVRGQGRFTADLPARFRARFVRSAIPAGRITSITAPDGGPDGGMVFTAADLHDVKPIRPMLHKFGYVPIEQPVLAGPEIRYVGDPFAVALAATEAEAEDLADRVEVGIAAAAPVTNAADAVAPGAPLVRAEVAGNVVVEAAMETAGHGAAMAGADRVVACSIRSNRQNASPLEPRAAHAAFDPASGRITLTCTTQTPHMMRTAIADLLGMREADLRVVAPDVGGGFGQKMSLAPEFVVLVWLARHLHASVAWTEDRRENLMASFHSRDMHLSIEGGFDDEARLIALSGDVLANVGAYAPYPNTAAVEPLMSLVELPGPYDVTEYACRVRGAITNTCCSAPYRGVARPALTLAMERLMDIAAREFGMEPWEIRRRNLVASFPYVSASGLIYDPGTYRETMELALRIADPQAFRARQKAARAQGRHLGIGLSTFCERTGYGSPAFAARGMEVTPGWETVRIAMDPSGAVEARIGASPHGQGLETTLAQIIADQLGLSPEAIRVIHGDTDQTPYGWGTFASRSLVIAGGASLLAARKVRDKLLAIAASMLEADAGDIVLADGEARIAGTDRAVSVATLARAAYHQAHRFAVEPGLGESATYDPAGTFSNACHIAVVELDPETCKVAIERFIVAEDAGRLINPMIVDGQIRGGVAQGIANALLEEVVYTDTGDILSTSLADYLLPTSREIPRIEIVHLETASTASITAAKGLGEGGTIGAPAAVLNAINDALAPFGARLDEIPATPARIHAALRGAR